MNEILIDKTSGDQKGHIDDLILFLENAKKAGATHYVMEWSHDPMWAFKWFSAIRYKSDEELRQEEIEILEEKLAKLKEKHKKLNHE